MNISVQYLAYIIVSNMWSAQNATIQHCTCDASLCVGRPMKDHSKPSHGAACVSVMLCMQIYLRYRKTVCMLLDR